MAVRITPAEIEEMHRLYKDLHNFAAVGRQMKRGASTVRRYVKLEDVPPIVRHTFKEIVRKV